MKEEEDTTLHGKPVKKMKYQLEHNSFDLNKTPKDSQKIFHNAEIPFKIALCCIASSLNLNIHGYGVLDYGGDMVQGYWDIDIPPTATDDEIAHRPLYGSPENTIEDAIESAAESIVRMFCKDNNVHVNDVNRAELDAKDKKLKAYQFWSDIFQEKAVNVNKDFVEANSKFNAMKTELENLCFHFLDCLPLERTFITEGAGKGNQLGVVLKYSGPASHPPDRKDQFALRLLQVLYGPKKELDHPPLSP